MALPENLFMYNYAVAAWDITSGKSYKIDMTFDDRGTPGDPEDPGDQNQPLSKLGFIWCTNQATSNSGNKHVPNYMGWLNSTNETVTNQLIGSRLYAYLLLNLTDTGDSLIIGPGAGKRAGGSGPFPAIGTVNYGFQNQPGSQGPINNSNDNTTQINTYNVGQVPGTTLFHQFSLPSTNQGGILITPISPFQENVYIHLLDGNGNVKCIFDSSSAGTNFWIPMDSSGLYLLASVKYWVDSQDSNKRDFNVGDPRTDGSMTVTELEP